MRLKIGIIIIFLVFVVITLFSNLIIKENQKERERKGNIHLIQVGIEMYLKKHTWDFSHKSEDYVLSEIEKNSLMQKTFGTFILNPESVDFSTVNILVDGDNDGKIEYEEKLTYKGVLVVEK